MRLAVMAGLLVAAPALAWAGFWYEHYDAAERALAAEQWAVAVEELNAAIARRGTSAARVRSYGMNVISYFPYLKLGVAYLKLGQYEAALRALETEERLGAVRESEEGWAELVETRARASAARDEAAASAGQRIDQIAREGLRAARAAVARGDLEGALSAAGRGLAVGSGDDDLVAALNELRADVLSRQRAQEDEDRSRELVADARLAVAAGELAQAATLLRRSLELRADPDAEALLVQVQGALGARVAADTTAQGRQRVVTDAISAAEALENEGRLDEALQRLETVLAVDRDNRQASVIQRRVLQRREQARVRELVTQVLVEAGAEMAAGHYERSLSAANRALALDPDSGEALDVVRRAYGEISRLLLGRPTTENIPPAIRFTDLRVEREGGGRVQRVRAPEFRLHGVVIDDTPVEIRLSSDDGRTFEATTTRQPVGDYFITEFDLETRLEPGSTVLRVEASDSGGLRSASEYEVRYDRPVWREPWVGTVALAFALLGAGGALVGRWHRRRRLRSRRFSPYIAGAPVLDDRLFVGREELVERIIQRVHNNSLLLHGERRIGKTSLQHHLKRRLAELDDPDYEFVPVYVDLQGTREEGFFALLAEEIFHELGPRLGGLRPSEPQSSDGLYGYRDLVGDLRRVLATLSADTPKVVKLVLLIDEVDELNDYDARINQKLRSLFMRSFAENLVAVVSGVEIRREWDREGSPWFNFFEEIEVTPLSREDAARLICGPIRRAFTVDAKVVDRIIDESQGRPYAIQRLCTLLLDSAYARGSRRISMRDLDAICVSSEAHSSQPEPGQDLRP